ncbi:MAG: (d)CMP kinase [Rhodospirillales bacterium]|nr:(d)CMP kinase [Rhodospirillales bacterium]
MSEAVVIAIDGPVAAGKGTLARRLAAHLGLAHLDSGMIYRATAARLLDRDGDPDNEDDAADAARKLVSADLERGDLRAQETSQAASRLASHPKVRQALFDFQRRFAETPSGAVIDGRDIGTVVCPDANVKLYVTATLKARARRRHDELFARGIPADLAAISDEIAERDRRDMERPVAPLRQAEDAVLLDTSEMDAEQAFEAAVEIVRQRLNRSVNATI